MSKAEQTHHDNTAADDAVPKGYWKDAQGNLVPAAKVKDLDKERDRVVRRLTQAAHEMSNTLAQFKLLAMSEIEHFVEMSAAQYGQPMRGAKGKGNVTLTSFDGRFKVERAVQETLVFDERLQVAKQIIDKCVHRWAKGANANIQALVNHAFQVDKQGNVSTARVLGLRQLDIKDADWDQAMTAIADSMKSTASKSYVRFYERNDATGQYEAISLNAATV